MVPSSAPCVVVLWPLFLPAMRKRDTVGEAVDPGADASCDSVAVEPNLEKKPRLRGGCAAGSLSSSPTSSKFSSAAAGRSQSTRFWLTAERGRRGKRAESRLCRAGGPSLPTIGERAAMSCGLGLVVRFGNQGVVRYARMTAYTSRKTRGRLRSAQYRRCCSACRSRFGRGTSSARLTCPRSATARSWSATLQQVDCAQLSTHR